ncbi:surface-adhesin E family protein [Phenylobacterium aquaticum]|uniref:surface-adhesin E family protein n=1 Tax=Phenylobacterium aquaticum TaxID=1763816 RepID=UPI0026F2F927|nr:surface-adhesin E family protein [Phenylobacterium aquaticum]
MNIFKCLILSGTVAVLGAATAQAQVYLWKEIGSGAGGVISYDPATVSQANGVTAATIQIKNNSGVGFQTPDGKTYQPAIMVERMGIDCATHQYSDLKNTGYDASGAQLYTASEVHGMIAIASGSPAAVLQATVCR